MMMMMMINNVRRFIIINHLPRIDSVVCPLDKRLYRM